LLNDLLAVLAQALLRAREPIRWWSAS